jgi:hypothetical protein
MKSERETSQSQLTSIRSDRGSFCCWGIAIDCGTHGPSGDCCTLPPPDADDGSAGPKIVVGTNCPGAKYGL